MSTRKTRSVDTGRRPARRPASHLSLRRVVRRVVGHPECYASFCLALSALVVSLMWPDQMPTPRYPGGDSPTDVILDLDLLDQGVPGPTRRVRPPASTSP